MLFRSEREREREREGERGRERLIAYLDAHADVCGLNHCHVVRTVPYTATKREESEKVRCRKRIREVCKHRKVHAWTDM